ncbi:MAG: hydroxyacid dehydrogenase [Clostridia bacterium]|nr:hydroxyacid dehydrogenase [Clostridia bacterium]
MKQAAFIGTVRNFDVYTPALVEKLKGELEFPVPEVLTKANLVQYEKQTQGIEYLFSTWGMLALTSAEIDRFFPALKAVFYAAGSVQGFARPFIEKGIAVFSSWAANGVPVAEYTVAQIVLANKGFFTLMHKPGSGPDWKRSKGDGLTGNYETTVGIIGAGMIGKMVINRLKTFDKIEILVFDPFLPDETAAELGVRKVPLTELFERCSVISNHLANNAQTKGMLNKDCFDRMSPTAVFINTGRGAQVVEDDLIAALKAEPGRLALLDVTFPEPPLPDSQLYKLPNVILTPHIAGSLHNEIHRMAEYAVAEYEAFDKGLPTKYSVTLKMLETMA